MLKNARNCSVTGSSSSNRNKKIVNFRRGYLLQRSVVLPQPLPEAAALKDAFAQSSLFPSSVIAEQRAILDACLAGGQILRAKNVWTRLSKAYDKSKGQQSRQASEDALAATNFSDIVPSNVHAAFLRAFFRAALAARLPVQVMGQVTAAWEWFQQMLEDPERCGRPNAVTFAVMLKGAIATSYTLRSKEKQEDKLITMLLETAPKYDVHLSDMLELPIFESQAPSVLGDVSTEHALDYLERLATTRELVKLSALVDQARTGATPEAGPLRKEEARLDPLQNVATLLPTLRPLTKAEAKTAESAKTTKKAAPVEAEFEDAKYIVPAKLDTLRGQLTSITEQRSTLSDPYARQRLLEESAYDAARRDFDRATENFRTLKINPAMGFLDLKKLVWQWTQDMKPLVEEASKEEAVFLHQIDPERAAFTAISELLPLCRTARIADGTTVAIACSTIGTAIEREIRADQLADFQPEALKETMQNTSQGNRSRMRRMGRLWREHSAQIGQQIGEHLVDWTQALRVKVGAALVAALIKSAKVMRYGQRQIVSADGEIVDENIREEQPAFYHTYQYFKGQKLGVVKCNPTVAEILRIDPAVYNLSPRQLPMVVPPRPWETYRNGCYMVQHVEVVRTADSSEQLAYVKEASARRQLDTTFEALDALGSTAWSVNRRIYDVVGQVWNQGIEIAGIPGKDPMLNEIDPLEPANAADGFDEVLRKEAHRKERRLALLSRQQAHSSRCSVNYQLEIARAYLGETMYFPHNMDFRGRAYPIPPNFSHIGDDLNRGLLTFAAANSLGPRGYTWLQVHLANTFGFDKASLEERAKFTQDHMSDVLDSADDPLGGARWWATAEDPWQCLAACFEVAGASRSENIQEYQSSLPVQQDGTCNGLQHYAALGGDLAGAKAVNLSKGDRPSDVYGHIARLASAVVDADAAKGNPSALRLQGKITRKVVKQTVMTTVYGVTFVGASAQIAKQLEGKLPPDDLYMHAVYLTKVALQCIGDLFSGATALRQWLTQTAGLVCRSAPAHRCRGKQAPDTMTAMIWTNPVGLPVVQPYRKVQRKQIATALQTVFLEDPSTPTEIDPKSQSTAFPPNFIHGLDASHMMMTAIECKKRGIVFASVHDSYWTHASDVDAMSSVLRNAFVELHSQPLLENLRDEILQRYAGFRIPIQKLPAALTKQIKDKISPSKGTSRSRKAATPPKTQIDEEESDEEMEANELQGLAAGLLIQERVETDLARLQIDNDQLDKIKPVFAASKTGSKASTIEKSILLADLIPPVPPRGDFDVKDVLQSLYFFS